MTTVTVNALYKSCGESHGKERLKRKTLRHLRKTDIEGADVTCWGRLFQVRAAATWKAQSPTVDSRVRRTLSNSFVTCFMDLINSRLQPFSVWTQPT